MIGLQLALYKHTYKHITVFGHVNLMYTMRFTCSSRLYMLFKHFNTDEMYCLLNDTEREIAISENPVSV